MDGWVAGLGWAGPGDRVGLDADRRDEKCGGGGRRGLGGWWGGWEGKGREATWTYGLETETREKDG